jgi:hypothetical protein
MSDSVSRFVFCVAEGTILSINFWGGVGSLDVVQVMACSMELSVYCVFSIIVDVEVWVESVVHVSCLRLRDL